MVGMPYSDDTNARIKMLLKCNIPFQTIAADERRPLSQIYRKKALLKFFNIINPTPLIGSGRPRSLTVEKEDAVMDFLNAYSTAFLDEIQAFMTDEFDIEISYNIINRILKRIKLTCQKIKPIYSL
jgi:hypothetical protein